MQKVSVIHLKHTASNQQGRGWDPAPPALSRILYDSSSSFSKTGLSQKACMPDYSHAIPPRKSEKAAYGSSRVAALSSAEGRWRETGDKWENANPAAPGPATEASTQALTLSSNAGSGVVIEHMLHRSSL